ncbi:MAG: chemotaxis protein CheA, partial [Zoogloea sp.]|nr:chemotaxis protein CheA [Zoogloea sp.]
MAIDMSQFFQVFFEEAAEHLANMEALLLAVDPAAPDTEDINALFRAAHSIKGSSGTFGFQDMLEVTHVLETMLDRVRKGEAPLTGEMVDASLVAGDVLCNLLAAHRGEGTADRAAAEAICHRLEALCRSLDKQPESRPVEVQASSEDSGDYGFFDELPAQPVDPAPQAGQDDSYGFFVDLPKEEEAYGFFDESGKTDVVAEAAVSADEGFGFFEPVPSPPDCVPSVAPVQALVPSEKPAPLAKVQKQAASARPAVGESGSIRVGVDKVDQMINLVGELVITQAMLTQAVGLLDPAVSERLMQGLTQLERNTRDLQESVMSIRMMPISVVFSRFPRV